jgi:hypothetical protein
LRDWDRPQFVIEEYEREFKQMDFEKRDIERIRNQREKVNALSAYHAKMRQLREE